MTTAVQPPQSAAEKRNQELAKSAWGMLNGMKASIAAILPKHLTPERMAMIAFTAMRQNPKLLQCSRESIIGSIMTASILGLEPSGPLGHGALIPYKGECQFQPMYQGLLELARRSGLIKDVQLRAVLKGDTYHFRFGLDPTIEHVPMEGDGADSPDRQCTHVYCIIRFVTGGIQWDQMSFAEAIAHAKRFSKTWDSQTQKFTPGTPWAEHPIAMAQKTVLKRTLKLCPKSPEMAQALSIDDLGEVGKMATLKQMPDGVYDVDFGGSEIEGGDGPSKTSSAIDRIVANRGHGEENLDHGNTHEDRPAGVNNQAGSSGARNDEGSAPVASGHVRSINGGPAQSGGAEGNNNIVKVTPEDVAAPQTAADHSDEKCTEAQFTLLENARNEYDVEAKVFIAWIKKTLGYKMASHLQQKHFNRALAFLRSGGKDGE